MPQGASDFSLIQTGFSAGELSPRLYGHADLAKYAQGLATARNGFIDIRGGFSSRPGTAFCGYAGDGSQAVRLIPFSFSTLETYVCEFGHYYIRFWQAGAPVLNDGVPFQLVSPYAASDLFRIRYAQSADTLWLAHPSYPQYLMVRQTTTTWNLSQIAYGATTPAPVPVSATAKVGGGSTTYRYVITATIGAEESLPSVPVAATSCAIMSQNGNEYVTVTWGAVAGATLYSVYRQQETPNGAPDLGSLYGLIGTTPGLVYQDANSAPDFGTTPQLVQNPFAGGAITAVTITNGGTGYSSATYLTVSDPTGQGFRGFPVITGGVWTGTVIQQGGWLYTNPTFTLVDPNGSGSGASGGGSTSGSGSTPGDGGGGGEANGGNGGGGGGDPGGGGSEGGNGGGS